MNEFEINSKTCTLVNEDEKSSVLRSDIKYIVPIYQRPYSWGENQLKKIVSDIFINFWEKEPMFIGTMQLSAPNGVESGQFEQNIIDGQQRLSTMLVFLKVLQIKYSVDISDIIKRFKLVTKVTEQQEQYLKEFYELVEWSKNVDESTTTSELNKYIQNYKIISNLIDDEIEKKEDESFDANDLLDYITKRVYFVVIETRAGLSKTLQIFNAINTTGLDLGSGDVFKIRFYEYLTDKEGQSSEVFNKITNLYSMVDKYNKELETTITFQDVLQLYKDFLIARYKLSNSCFKMGTTRFFETLFDTKLDISTEWKLASKENIENLKLKIDDLINVIDAYFEQIKIYRKISSKESILTDEFFAGKMISMSRYGGYARTLKLLVLSNIFANKEGNKEIDYDYNYNAYLLLLSKILAIYSIEHKKAVNAMHQTMYEIMKKMFTEPESILSYIREKIIYISGKNNNCNNLKKNLSNEIAGVKKWKNLICYISAYLDEKNSADFSMQKLKTDLFSNKKFDIEHIHATNDKRLSESEMPSRQLQNSIGNLVLLEYDINRKIQDIVFAEKKKAYGKSKVQSVQNLLQYERWTVKEIEERRNSEVEKIAAFLTNIDF